MFVLSSSMFGSISKHHLHAYALVTGQAPVSGHLSPTPLVAAYENHSRKRPAPVTDIFYRVPRVSAYESFDCIIIDEAVQKSCLSY